MDKIGIGNRLIGDAEPCFIIAEVGVNHNGDFNLAKKMIDEAKRAGADAVKFQTFKSEGVATTSTSMAEYQKENLGLEESQLMMLKNLELEYPDFIKLEEYCRANNIIFLSTPHSFDAIDFLDSIVPAYKVGSGDLTNIPALELMAQKGKPMVISTGMATLAEISDAVAAVRDNGNQQIVLLQCVSNYPSSLHEQNLLTIKTLRERFHVLTGFSDHTVGTTASLVAVSLGACIIEKHFTLDRTLPGPDHKASIEPKDLRLLIDLIRDVEKAIGNGIKEPTAEELKTAEIARKSLVARVDIAKDKTITRDMIDIKRPQTGIRPRRLKAIIGRKAAVHIPKDSVLTEDMIQWSG